MSIAVEELAPLTNKILNRLNDLNELLTVLNLSESNKNHVIQFAADGGIFYGTLAGAAASGIVPPESVVLSAEQWLSFIDNLFDSLAEKMDDDQE